MQPIWFGLAILWILLLNEASRMNLLNGWLCLRKCWVRVLVLSKLKLPVTQLYVQFCASATNVNRGVAQKSMLTQFLAFPSFVHLHDFEPRRTPWLAFNQGWIRWDLPSKSVPQGFRLLSTISVLLCHLMGICGWVACPGTGSNRSTIPGGLVVLSWAKAKCASNIG